VILFTAAAAALLLLLTVWPFRLYGMGSRTAQSSAPAGVSETVVHGQDQGEYFLATDTHLKSAAFWLSECAVDGTASVRIYDNSGAKPQLLIDRSTEIKQSLTGGWIEVALGVDTTPGSQYILILNTDDKAEFSVGYAAPSEETPGYQVAFHADQPVNGYHMLLSLKYYRPLSVKRSLALAAAILLLAGAVCFFTRRFYRRYPDRNRKMTVEKAMRYILTPVVVVAGGALFIFIWPLELFDWRLPDLLLLEAGTVIAVLVCLYGLWHDRSELPDTLNRKILRERWPDYVQAVLIALILQFCCEYMNDLYDIYHRISERRMTIAFLLLVLSMNARSRRKNRSIPVCGAAAGAAGLAYVLMNRVPAAVKESALQNEALILGAVCFVLYALCIQAAVLDILDDVRRRKCGEEKRRLGDRICVWYTAVLALLFVLIVVRRNTRWWPVALAVGMGLFYIRYFFWQHRERWLRILCGGIVLQFVCVVIWCLFRRYYLAFLYERFPMNFHTVTVTGEYLMVIEGAAATLLIGKVRQAGRMDIRRLMDRVWKEALLFGTATVYLFFTLSRTGIASAGAALICMLIAAAVKDLRDRKEDGSHGRRPLYALRSFCIMLLSFVLLFAPVYTLQRTVPAMVGRPFLFAEMEEYPDDVMIAGPDNWDSLHFMCIERYDQVMRNKLFGLPEGSYDFGTRPGETVASQAASSMNADTGSTALIAAGETAAQSASSEMASGTAGAGDASASAQDTSGQESTADTESGSEAGVKDYTNGRLSIYKSYLKDINLAGHDTMGAELDDGEIAMHAHDTYLQVAWDHGIPVGIWFFLVLALTFFRSSIYYRKSMTKREFTALLPMAETAGFAIAGIVEWVFEYSHPLTIALLFSVAPLLLKKGKTSVE
jgi:hypothetical protein